MSPLRIAALLSTGSLALHELRWLLAPAADEPPHGYVPIAGAVAGLLLALAAAQLIARVARRQRESGALPFRRACLLAVVALLAIFTVQELAEGALLAGGSWLALPLSLPLGAAIALALSGAGALVAAAGRRPRLARSRPALLLRPRSPRARPQGVLALNLAGRAPPQLR